MASSFESANASVVPAFSEPAHRDSQAQRRDESSLAAPRPKKVRRDDVIYMTTQLAVMVDTGVPLPEALDAIADQTEHTGLRALVAELCEDVKSGTEFSSALQKHPRVFGELFSAMMKASEMSGSMGHMLQRVSEYMERERDTRKKVVGAMTYPLCMLSFCALVVLGLLVFILPRFERIYAGKGAMLPLPTRALMGLSNLLLDQWHLIIGGTVTAVVAIVWYFRTDGGQLTLDAIRLRVPLLGPMYRKACLARSLRTLATMVSSGVSMLEGLEITARVSGNHHYARVWRGVAARVKEGSSVSDALHGSRLMPPTVWQMISAGERTGKLANVLNRVANFCENELGVAIKTLTSMIEPVMIIVMGLLVGGIAMALLLPVFSLSKVMSH